MKVKKTIVLLPGDGIGPEVTRAAATVLRECAQEFHHEFDLHEFPIGGAAIDGAGTPLPNETLDACRKADAVFLGAVGGSKWDSLPVGKRPESGLLGVAQGHGAVRQCAPGEGAGAFARNFAVEAGASGRFGYRDCARACGRDVLRRARQRDGKWSRAGLGHGIVFDAGDRADCDVRVWAGGESLAAACVRSIRPTFWRVRSCGGGLSLR